MGFFDAIVSFVKTTLPEWLNEINDYVWGFPSIFPIMIVLLLGTGFLVSFRLGWIQLRRVKHAIDITRGRYDDPKHAGDISHFQALSAALSATIGIGNIAGVATAIHYGGPGALFWMWLTGILGTSLKYAECTLSMKYRKINPDGSASGGPMYYIEKALGWKWLAVIFAAAAALCALATGNAIQAFTVSDQLSSDFAFPPWGTYAVIAFIIGLILVFGVQITSKKKESIGRSLIWLIVIVALGLWAFNIDLIGTGAVIAFLVGLVIIGGIKRIGRVTAVLAPTMTVLYVVGAVSILIMNVDKIPGAFSDIIKMAFTPPGAIGLFSNEAGQGSAPIAHAAAKTDEPVREGTVAMMGPYIDTITICTLTGLAIIVTGSWNAVDGLGNGLSLNGSPLTSHAFKVGLPFLGFLGKEGGGYLVTAAVLLFATSTMISWSYYGDRSIQYLLGDKVIIPYRYLFCIMIFVGSGAKLEAVWTFGDIALGIMAIPNLIALIALSGVTTRMTREYFSRKHTPLR
jgi:AGCS family alanine or glycine:cation symporter